MEEVCLDKEEESASDVNVYVTIDPASLQKFKKSSSRKKKSGYPQSFPIIFKDCLDELGLNPSWSFCFSVRGLLLMFEIVLSLTLLLIAAIADGWIIGYTAKPVGITMNVISFDGFIILFIWQFLDVHCFCQYSVERFIELAVYLLFVILHIISFIVSMVDESDPYGALVAFRIISIIMCCSILLSIYFTNDEYLKNKKSVLPQTNSKKERLRRSRQKKRKYKRLHHSGF